MRQRIYVYILLLICLPIHAQWSHWAKRNPQAMLDAENAHLYGHTIHHCEINHKGTYALTSGVYGKNSTFILWKLPEGHMIKRLTVPMRAYAYFSEYEPYIIYIECFKERYGGKINNAIWDIRTGQKIVDASPLKTRKKNDPPIAPYFAIIDEQNEHEARIISYNTQKEICRLDASVNDKNGQIMLSDNGSPVFANKKERCEQQVRQMLKLKASESITQILPKDMRWRCYDMDISPDNKYILFCTANNGTVYLYSIEEKRTYTFHAHTTTCAGLFIDEGSFVVGTTGGKLQFFQLEEGQPIYTIDAFSCPVQGIAIDKEKGILYSCAKEPEWKIWDLITYELVQTFVPLPDGRTIIL